jgi:hypothetical protein
LGSVSQVKYDCYGSESARVYAYEMSLRLIKMTALNEDGGCRAI